jgi:hypothetical protein
MNRAFLLASSVALFLITAKAHGRELRLEREAAGVAHVVFGGDNPAFVEALWKAERLRFWTLTPALALVLAVALAARGAPTSRVGLAVLAWAPSVVFAALGLFSMVRAGGLARGALAGSFGWWSLAAAVAATTAVAAQAAK